MKQTCAHCPVQVCVTFLVHTQLRDKWFGCERGCKLQQPPQSFSGFGDNLFLWKSHKQLPPLMFSQSSTITLTSFFLVSSALIPAFPQEPNVADLLPVQHLTQITAWELQHRQCSSIRYGTIDTHSCFIFFLLYFTIWIVNTLPYDPPTRDVLHRAWRE